MAVQAQYPSNVLLLNSKTGQEGHDYSLQPQPGGYLDQSYMLFNNGGNSNNNNNNNNSQKRGREVTATTTSAAAPINPFSMLNQPPQLINLSQLHNHQQQNVVSTGLRLSFGDQQQQQQQLQQSNHHHHHHHHHHQEQQQQLQQNIICQSPSFLSEDFSSQIKRQRDEIDQFLQAQGEQLRRTLAEKRQRHYRALLGAAEESISRRLREKEAEVEKAARRNAELEARAAQLSVEAQVWQAKARAQEATAATLQAQLQQAIMTGGVAAQDSRRGDDGLMCSGEPAEDAESAYIDPDRVVSVPMSGPTCKACRKRVASVVLLPCRHLCVCTECDRVVQACPVCFNMRNSSVEVILS